MEWFHNQGQAEPLTLTVSSQVSYSCSNPFFLFGIPAERVVWAQPSKYARWSSSLKFRHRKGVRRKLITHGIHGRRAPPWDTLHRLCWPFADIHQTVFRKQREAASRRTRHMTECKPKAKGLSVGHFISLSTELDTIMFLQTSCQGTSAPDIWEKGFVSLISSVLQLFGLWHWSALRNHTGVLQRSGESTASHSSGP